MINRQKFLMPTLAYVKENTLLEDKSVEVVKDWYNADLIFFAIQYKNKNYAESVMIQMAYKEFQTYYGISQTLEDLDGLFGDYPAEDFNELLRELVQNNKKDENTRSN